MRGFFFPVVVFLLHVFETVRAFSPGARLPVSSIACSSKRKTSLAVSGTDFNLEEYLMSKKVAVDKALAESVVAKSHREEKISESMRYSLLAGGKRVRPALCIAACEMMGGTQELAMPTAVALEMIHTMSLIHDDLPAMDNDTLRRGKPTNHVLFGENIAILAGDALLSTSFEHVARYTKGADPARVVEVIMRLGESVGVRGLAGGQTQDLLCENKSDVTVEDLRWIHMHKTAALLKVSVTSGVILAGGNDVDVKRAEIFAENIGLAFQIADDILDVTKTSEELGKTAGKDENANKATYPKLLGLEGSKAEAERLTREAKQQLLPYGDHARPLLALADFIINRSN